MRTQIVSAFAWRSQLGPVLRYAGALSLIGIAVVPWGDFQGHTHWSKVAWIPFVSPPIRIRDIAANVLLFCPLGVASVAALRTGDMLWRTIVLGAGISIAGEWSQLYSHSRFPSATDIVCNTGGALLGAWLMSRLRRGAANES